MFFPAPYWNNGAAIVVVGPQTSVKEQVSTEYAKRLRALGFIALAYDPRTYGESDGEPREFENPQWKVEDIKSAVKFMGTLQEVENSRVGVLGVCCGGMYAARAATEDPHIRAVAIVAGNLMNPENQKDKFGAGYDKLLQLGKDAKIKYEQTGIVDYVPNIPDSPSDYKFGMPFHGSSEVYGQYLNDKNTRWKNRSAAMFWEPFLQFDVLKDAEKIQIPTVIFHSNLGQTDVARQLFSKIRGEKEGYLTNTYQTDFLNNPLTINQTSRAVGTFLMKHLNYEKPNFSDASVTHLKNHDSSGQSFPD